MCCRRATRKQSGQTRSCILILTMLPILCTLQGFPCPSLVTHSRGEMLCASGRVQIPQVLSTYPVPRRTIYNKHLAQLSALPTFNFPRSSLRRVNGRSRTQANAESLGCVCVRGISYIYPAAPNPDRPRQLLAFPAYISSQFLSPSGNLLQESPGFPAWFFQPESDA